MPFNAIVQVSPTCGVPLRVRTALLTAATAAEPAGVPTPASAISKLAVRLAAVRLVSTRVGPTGVATRSPARVLIAVARASAISLVVSATDALTTTSNVALLTRRRQVSPIAGSPLSVTLTAPPAVAAEMLPTASVLSATRPDAVNGAPLRSVT